MQIIKQIIPNKIQMMKRTEDQGVMQSRRKANWVVPVKRTPPAHPIKVRKKIHISK